ISINVVICIDNPLCQQYIISIDQQIIARYKKISENSFLMRKRMKNINVKKVVSFVRSYMLVIIA
ncbi:hypothetical protein, partial [Staphylococcus aureus]|uniref:hypothetical protein n=1 Tax=Staphylococcus aureus TaxID=1280 RepID=UPI00301E1605